jgi:hypothetical protein
MSDPVFIQIPLWDRSAIVLFDWLMATNEKDLPYSHPGQKQALRDLLTALEGAAPTDFTEAELASAQDRVARDMADEDRDI